jgi:arabinogalactan oligomer/maltooligosaccharide transport system permease protein
LAAGNSEQVVLIAESEVSLDGAGLITSVHDFNLLPPEQYSLFSDEIQSLEIRLGSTQALIPDDYDYLSLFKAGKTYSEARDEIVDIATGTIYRSNDNGQMVSASGEVLYPGWKANVGFRNFTSIFANEEVRRPLLAVVAWTLINAILVVVFSFLMGLILALIFNFPALRSKRLYRTIFIIPLAIPSVLSILVWAGLFQTSNGVINRLFHSEIPWLTDSTWARIAILVVELWISFPYMFLISTGAIQSIPGEILEAASIDGASNFKSFTQIKLPLVIRTVAPLLVASGAMALNNFGIIYLLTGGGPTLDNSNGNAGATDILISYTYKLAFNAQEGSNYGLASALSILNFFMVGLISIYGLRRIKTMEGIN